MKITFLYTLPPPVTDSPDQEDFRSQAFHNSTPPRVGEHVDLFVEEVENVVRFQVRAVRWEFFTLMGSECTPEALVLLSDPVVQDLQDPEPITGAVAEVAA